MTDAGGAGASISNTTGGGLNTTAKHILSMLQALLDVIGTIAHPDSIEEAKKVVATIRDDFSAYDVHANAVRVLEKVCVGIANGADPDVVDTQSCADAPSSLIRLI